MILRKVKNTDYKYLYDLLAERESYTNISHKDMPSYLEHCIFLDKSAYDYHYIIEVKCERVGQIYITRQGEIGIQIAKEHFGHKYGEKAVITAIFKHRNEYKRLLANIAPSNNGSKRLFKRLGFKLIQNTYELMS